MTSDGNTAGAVTRADDAAWQAAYAEDTAKWIVRRLPHGALIMLSTVVAVSIVDVVQHPDRFAASVLRFALVAVLCAAGVLGVRVPAVTRHAVGFVLVLLGGVIGALTSYDALIGTPASQIVNGQLVLLTGTAVIVPWSWRPQVGLTAAAVAALWIAAPVLPGDPGYALAILCLGGAVSAYGASFLGRYRYAAFVRAAQLQEEAEIGAVVLRVSATMSARLDDPELFTHVSALLAEAAGSEASLIFVRRPEIKGFRLVAATGVRAELRAHLDQLEFGSDALEVVRRLTPEDCIEIPTPAGQSLLPADLMRMWNVASLLIVPICRQRDVIGALVVSYRTRTGPFTAKQRRLVCGIAQATAVAIENARLIADLQRVSRLKSEFVSTMSHELRTPLNVVIGYTQMARDPDATAAEIGSYLGRAEAAGRDLLGLIEDTLEMGRIEAGRDEVRLEPVLLPELWARIADAAARLPRHAEVALEWGVPPETSVVTDTRKLTVILRNLIGNALKFTERGTVRAEATLDGGVLVLRVADTGPGIRAEDQRIIFEMFRQVDGSDSRRHGGVGLGLHIVRRFVHQLQGTIDVASAPGRGSVFTVRVPLPVSAAAA